MCCSLRAGSIPLAMPVATVRLIISAMHFHLLSVAALFDLTRFIIKKPVLFFLLRRGPVQAQGSRLLVFQHKNMIYDSKRHCKVSIRKGLFELGGVG